MSFVMILRSLFELALVLFVLWAVFHEDLFIAFEDRIFSRIRRRNLRLLENGSTVHTTRHPAGSIAANPRG